MIDYNAYKVLHLFGVFSLFLAFGAAAVTEKSQTRWAAPLHGIALLLVLVAGFGMLAQLGIHGSLPAWAIGKLVIWLIFGGSIALVRKKKLPAVVTLLILAVLGAAAAALALYKP